MFSEFDRLAMTRALALAERGLETTHPNPRVGCVIAKSDRVIAEGFHERAGHAHAEVAALHAANEPVAGATVYVTLEPCSHQGRTPPCVNALIKAGVARVIFAVQDPNPQVSGQGAEALRRAGITVEVGLMAAEATELNIGFMKRMKDGLPWVRVKLAMSLDGRTALANGASHWITGEAARFDVQRWRARSSAVLTGVGTVIADDCRLSVRVAGFKGRQPLRVVLDAMLRTPPDSKLFDSASEVARGMSDDVLIITAAAPDPTATDVAVADAADEARWVGAALSGAIPMKSATPDVRQGSPSAVWSRSGADSVDAARRAALLARGARIEDVAAEGGFLNLAAVLRRLAELEVNELLVEAGPTLAGRLVAGSFVDELLLYVAPKFLGPQGRPLVNLPELSSLQHAWGFSLFEVKRFGDDLRMRLRPG